MARRELGPAALQVVQAVAGWLGAVGQPVVVACSGGADSLALAAGLAYHQRRDPELASRTRALIVDHGLQPGSEQVAARVAARLQVIGLDAQVCRAEVATDSPAGLEAAARTARYRTLAVQAGPGAQVLLGHTLDDQAETVLLGLARGSGTRSLAGMPMRTGDDPLFVRPLLGLRRSTTAQACAEWALEVWDDPHNAQPRFTRVRVRQRVLPVLEDELGPGVAEALARTASLAQADADALDQLAAAFIPGHDEGLPVAVLTAQPQAIATRVLRGWLIAGGVLEPSYAHLQAVWKLVTDWHGQHGVDLPGAIRVRRVAGVLQAEKLT